ncbi:MAG TPA: CHAT domain-containing protein [Blastocatellia bacterium]|nr:CHAT domain-containing protein [Blastocatellia bacterium]
MASNNEIAVNQLEDERLEPGKPIARKLAGGELHSYRVILSAGQFLHAVIEEQGIDTVITLFGPDSKQIVKIDGPNSKPGSKLLQAVAEVEGDYRLEVRAMEKQASAGKYVIKIEELRVATSQDRKRFAAELAFAAASRLEEQGTAEALKEALEKYDETLLLMRDAGNHKGEAYAIDRMGGIYRLLGESHKALEYYNRALAILQGMGVSGEEASILNNAAIIHNTLGEGQKALEYYNRALSLVRAAGDWLAESTVLTNMGAVHQAMGETQKALEHFDLALQLTRAKGGQNPVTLNGIGAVYDSLGEKQKALEYYNLALSIFQSRGDWRAVAVVQTNIGLVYVSMGEKQKALEYYNLALPQFQSAGHQRAVAITLNHIGFAYELLSDSRKALDYYDKALSLIQVVGDRHREAIILHNISSVYTALDEKQKALDYCSKALLLSRALNARRTEALVLYRAALTHHSLNNLVEARVNIEAALEIVESIRTNVASSELRASYFASAQKHYDFYIDLLMRLDQLHPNQGYDAMALHASERARARTLLEMLTEARVDIYQGVEPSLLDRERSLKQLLGAKTEKQVNLLSRKHTQQEAELIDKEIEQLRAQYHEVKSLIKIKSPGYAALTQPRPLTLKEIQRDVVDADTLLLEYALGEKQSYLWAVTQDSIVTFRLPKRAEIEEAAQRVYDLLSVDQRKRSPQLDGGYTKAVSALSEIVLGPVAAHLGKKRLLIVPQGALSYIPFAALPAVQKQATTNARQLVDSSPEPLIAKHEIIYLPSASTLAVLRKELAGRKLPPKAVAVIADPVFSKDDVRVRAATKAIDEQSGQRQDEPNSPSHNISQIALLRSTREVGLGDGKELPRLPFSRKEAQAIFALGHPAGAMNALDFNATREIVTSAEMGQYRIVHFATHGLLNNEHPELSGLVLSLVDKKGQPQNGFLRLYDIYNLRLGADLVVLSACHTALGKQIKGEGLVGVTRGFMYSGAGRVIGSLWKVDDEATAELMERFYLGIIKEKQKPAAALREAQLWMRKQKRWQFPYYWSGFILQGEWR